MRGLLSLAVLTALIGGEADAKQVTLEYFYLPPFSYSDATGPAGSALALAQSISTDLNIVLRPELTPLRRLTFEAAKNPVLVAALFRTPAREASYQWIGRLCTEHLSMVTRAPAPTVDSLEQAKNLKQIGVAAGASNETFLRERGFTNLDAAASIELEVRRLAEGYDDAWFAPRSGALHAWKVAGYDPAQLHFGTPITSMEIWLAASNVVSPPIVETLRARFEEKVKSGEVSAATGCAE